MEYQQEADNFEGAKLLTALALATHIGANASMGGYDKSGETTTKEVRQKLNQAASDIANRTGHDFNYQDQIRVQRLHPKSSGYPGYMQRYFEDEGQKNLSNPRMFRISYGPDVDPGVYAHELGHVIAQNNDMGLAINKVKKELTNNKSLGEFLEKQAARMPEAIAPTLRPFMSAPKVAAMGRLAVPAALAAAIPGDDDASSALAASLILASPTLVDEALAHKYSLDVMKDAGMPATPRQKLRMAGAWGSYLAKPLTAALIGNVAGNVIEEL